jgi:hypothetical protein
MGYILIASNVGCVGGRARGMFEMTIPLSYDEVYRYYDRIPVGLKIYFNIVPSYK